MAYAEFLRIRKSLAWHAGVLAAITLLALSVGGGTTIVNGQRFEDGMTVPVSALVIVGMFFAAVFASSAGTSLNRENQTIDLSWTKPLPRTLLALHYVLVDAAGVLIAFVLTMAAVLIVLERYGLHAGFDVYAGPRLLLAAGVALMWYGLVQVLTFWGGSGLRSLGGILWPVMLLFEGLAGLRGTAGTLARAVDVINPLAYLGTNVHVETGIDDAVWGLPTDEKLVIVWAFALAFCAIAVTLWPKREAS